MRVSAGPILVLLQHPLVVEEVSVASRRGEILFCNGSLEVGNHTKCARVCVVPVST